MSTDSPPRSRALYSRPYPVFDSSQSTGFLVAQRFRGRDAQERRTAAHWRAECPAHSAGNRQRTSLSFVLAVFAIKSQRPFVRDPALSKKKGGAVYWTKVQ